MFSEGWVVFLMAVVTVNQPLLDGVFVFFFKPAGVSGKKVIHIQIISAFFLVIIFSIFLGLKCRRRFTPLEKATTFNRWSLPIEGDGGLKPPSPQTAHPVRKLLPNGVKKRSSLTGFTGRIFISYLLLYGIFCFIIESFRGNPRGSFWIFSTSQWISMPIVIAGIISREWLLREPS